MSAKVKKTASKAKSAKAEKSIVQLTVRVPESWLPKFDELATKLSVPGVVVTRTEAVRAVLAKGIGAQG